MGNKHIKEIRDGKKLLAIFYSKKLRADGVRFLTPLHFPLQIGLLEHKHGKKVDLHRHPDLRYRVNTTQEMLYIEKGSADVAVTNNRWKVIGELTLTKGDFILFVAGAHSVNIAQGSRIIEVKQGPYPGDKRAKILKK